MPNYKQLMGMANCAIYAILKAGIDFGLTPELIINEMADIIADEEDILFAYTDLKIEGSDVKSVVESFKSSILEIGYCQKVDILEVSDSKVVIDLGDSVFAPAIRHLRGKNLQSLEPDPMIVILYAAIEHFAGKKGYISGDKYVPEENMDVYTITLEEA